ncbi:50S ribosomal protein L30e [Candidatus Woesearchaeota archaeon]|nr:50S ribosomal protein L30e [Candidatus Woesearchaeota archaeon]
MAKKLTASEIKKILKSKEVIIGTERTIKNIKLGNVEKIIISSNCPEKVLNDIDYYAKLGNIPTIKVDYPNTELGVICKKPYSISLLSILKGG